ncbi:unnamed protein product [Cladocopium goreaui]|uniref:Uncharacterized protein n=1 Tax=Cladocopium goreaui TaxID=2562237 RepID=A0A9P1GPY1_9DINO|nr:unnamed protein product [Cladocopium goreaui]
MGGGRNPHREEQVKGLNNVALAHGKAAIRENSGRPLVRDLVAELLRLELIAVQRDKVSQLSASYEASFGEAGEGPQPEANEEHKACKVSAGAIRLGHFYVVADLFHYTTYPPFQAYAVEGWWLDNLLKGGKLTRQTYLTTVGFQKRLGDCKAAERFLREEVVRDKPHI